MTPPTLSRKRSFVVTLGLLTGLAARSNEAARKLLLRFAGLRHAAAAESFSPLMALDPQRGEPLLRRVLEDPGAPTQLRLAAAEALMPSRPEFVLVALRRPSRTENESHAGR